MGEEEEGGGWEEEDYFFKFLDINACVNFAAGD
jgi:hypothetical protein